MSTSHWCKSCLAANIEKRIMPRLIFGSTTVEYIFRRLTLLFLTMPYYAIWKVTDQLFHVADGTEALALKQGQKQLKYKLSCFCIESYNMNNQQSYKQNKMQSIWKKTTNIKKPTTRLTLNWLSASADILWTLLWLALQAGQLVTSFASPSVCEKLVTWSGLSEYCDALFVVDEASGNKN